MGSNRKIELKKCDFLQDKEVRWKSLVSLLCAVQVMIAFALSADQVIKTYHEISRNPVLYILGTIILFLFESMKVFL